MQGPQHELRGAPLWPLGVLVALFATVDLLMAPMTRPGPDPPGMFLVFGVLMGLMAGQAGLVTLWAVFGSHPWAPRWLATLGAAELLLVAFLVGIILGGNSPPSFEEFVVVPLCLPLAFLILQAPLWLFRAITGWQIVPRDREETSRGARQFGIVDLLAATAFTALALGLTQVAISFANRGRAATPDVLWPFVLVLAIAAVANALLSLPCLWAVFAARDRAQAVAVLSLWYFLLGVAWVVLLTVMSGREVPGEVLGVTVIFEVVDVAALVGGLCLIRAGPYVLLRPRQRQAAAGIGAGADVGTCPFAPAVPGEPPPGESPKAEDGELKADG